MPDNVNSNKIEKIIRFCDFEIHKLKETRENSTWHFLKSCLDHCLESLKQGKAIVIDRKSGQRGERRELFINSVLYKPKGNRVIASIALLRDNHPVMLSKEDYSIIDLIKSDCS